jgi:hypothetical protein
MPVILFSSFSLVQILRNLHCMIIQMFKQLFKMKKICKFIQNLFLELL